MDFKFKNFAMDNVQIFEGLLKKPKLLKIVPPIVCSKSIKIIDIVAIIELIISDFILQPYQSLDRQTPSKIKLYA